MADRSWSPQWILGFLRAHKNDTPFSRLAEEAGRSLRSAEELRGALAAICALVDNKSASVARRATEEVPTRKRRRPSNSTDESARTPDRSKSLAAQQPGSAALDKRLHPDENHSPAAYQQVERRRQSDSHLVVECSTEGTILVPEERRARVRRNSLPARAASTNRSDDTANATVGANESTASTSLPVSPLLSCAPATLQFRQIRYVCELCKLARFLCHLSNCKSWGVAEALDVDVKAMPYAKTSLLSRLFVGVLYTIVDPAHATHQTLPSEQALDRIVTAHVLPVLREPCCSAATAPDVSDLTKTFNESITTDGLEELRSWTHKLVKIYNCFLSGYTSRIWELSTFASVDPKGPDSPKRKVLLEKAVFDLRRNLERICGIDTCPDSVEAMKGLIVEIYRGSSDYSFALSFIKAHELSVAWLAGSQLAITPPANVSLEQLMQMMSRHFEKYADSVEADQAKRAKAEEAARAKEEERRSETQNRLTRITPIIEYLVATEAIAQRLRTKAGGTGALNPCVVLGVPFECVTKPIMKRIKLKVQAVLHPDKFNLDWLQPSRREEWLGRINHAFRLVTEALNELQKYDSNSAMWTLAPATMPPPYAEDVGIVWKAPTSVAHVRPTRHSTGTAAEGKGERAAESSVPPPTARMSADPGSAPRCRSHSDSQKRVPVTPLIIRNSHSAVVSWNPPPTKKPHAAIPLLCRLEFPEKLWVRQGILEVDVTIHTNSTIDNRCLTVWVAAPKLKEQQQPFATRVVACYIFTLALSRRHARFQLENIPMLGNNTTQTYEIMWQEHVETKGANGVSSRFTDCQCVAKPVVVPPLREGGVNLYRTSLTALYELAQAPNAYAEILAHFPGMLAEGLNTIKALKKFECRQLLETVFKELQPHLE